MPVVQSCDNIGPQDDQTNHSQRTRDSGRSAAENMEAEAGCPGNFSEENIDFAVKEGFTSIGLWAHRRTILDASNITSQTVDRVKSAISRSGLRLSVIATTENHVDPDLAKRDRGNEYFQKTIELAGALGIS